MLKKITIVILMLMLLFLPGCGGKSEPGNAESSKAPEEHNVEDDSLKKDIYEKLDDSFQKKEYKRAENENTETGRNKNKEEKNAQGDIHEKESNKNTQKVKHVSFADANLEKVIRKEINKLKGEIYPEDLLEIKKLIANEKNIKGLEGIEYLKNLENLQLHSNQISDLTPLKELKNLKFLWLHSNNISDLTPLVNLTNLEDLHLSNNIISDVSPIKGLKNLKNLWLHSNKITDVKPLENLTGLIELSLYENKIKDISPLKKLFSQEMKIHLNDNPIEHYSVLYVPFNAAVILPENAPKLLGLAKQLADMATVHDGQREGDNIIYKSKLLGISFKLPINWKGKYLIGEKEDTVMVFHNPSDKEYPSIFFSIIELETIEEWEARDEEEIWPYEKIGYRNGKVIVSNPVSYDVYEASIDKDNDSKEFFEMCKDIEYIISTVEIR
ncbi:MAG TPA: leucine-rich repeat domain-containing protein [Defluviitaleaceae bacterium]|jgi:hypothetical protein|uniref:leucine-rich repeat domain-containing protein n=1 Tax=Acetivibrio saccincola TaxID=1677857 RepID=UPI002C63FA2D|nr:leucine-rich repeat domain-containing protein [Acetivibrio saccincola]HOA80850.1 leucine-rich repeat domain-containing protein [Defluviitaleaceae bacterium]HQD29953.1 leucine-rich repeat domain-containing protein [Acetivibrio saccincola]